MKFYVRPKGHEADPPTGTIPVELYARPSETHAMTAGAAVLAAVRRGKLEPTETAWDFLTIALSAIVADAATLRRASPDGWTRELDLDLALNQPDLWREHLGLLTDALRFLTTDIWGIEVTATAEIPYMAPKTVSAPDTDCVALLSGGLDSLIGGIDLNGQGRAPFFVSQTVRGDAAKQTQFADRIDAALTTIHLNHSANTADLVGGEETSQRIRSLIFIAYAVLAASTLDTPEGKPVDVFVNENGLISINPALTPMRVGSLSTRTAHPRFLGLLQQLFTAVGLNVRLVNPYRLQTKGQMLVGCHDQDLLEELAHTSTSCGRFQRYNYRHCGRCLPCQVRRAAFLHWDKPDATGYVFGDLGIKDEDHAAFDDVRSVAMARVSVQEDGLQTWAGTSLSWVPPEEREATKVMIGQGLDELGKLHDHYDVS